MLEGGCLGLVDNPGSAPDELNIRLFSVLRLKCLKDYPLVKEQLFFF